MPIGALATLAIGAFILNCSLEEQGVMRGYLHVYRLG